MSAKAKEKWMKLRSKGWKAVALVVGYYLVRDITLYVLIPLWIAAKATAN